ncbi:MULTISPECIES: hypothetical protein [Brevibacillus]|uniref:hypothetical protein n=1 Tax=Brevibacillus TaxID=55080 RepID=UPI000D106039|nr:MULTISPECIES: hypothetical protein [Brevibacillus]PSJ70149.1 hypothetical protein C7J99_06225 [Brevibacillus brevis]RED30024.1 hypothetical protein DES34_105241 [Brevibacillus brevis]TQK74838.1 hypothetical protein FB479_101447 [Brevibacillus sp. AG162]VEF88571.1 Uncharacterised protein [Brevibacillus brevis]GEC88241.1 hypothetical protein BBR01nite_05720 [Brevibacillus brevis]
MKALRKKKLKAKQARCKKRSTRRKPNNLLRQLRRFVRIHVRAPRVNVTTPTPQVEAPVVQVEAPVVQVEAPVVQVEAPKPIVIPAPVVKVDVETEETAEQACIEGLRQELSKCMRNDQLVEVLLTTDWGPESRSYRIGKLLRVEEGIIELQTLPSSRTNGASILIPITHIVAIIPNAEPN